MTEELPEYENAIKIYEDKPNLATMLSGGIFIAVVTYFISDFFFELFGIENNLLNFILPGLLIIISFNLGSNIDVRIKINTKTGYIEAKGGGYRYEAYANEPERFIVLQKHAVGRGNTTYTDYKISLVVDEETAFDVPLRSDQVRDAIQAIEKAKKAVPVYQSEIKSKTKET